MALLRRLKLVRKPRTQLVLCWFEYYAKHSGLTKTYTGTVMVEVESSSQIQLEFERTLLSKLHDWYDRTWTPKPMSWSLTAYLPENGQPVF
jgi:hypothetical protein